MKLLSFIHQGRETWGAVIEPNGVVDLGRLMPQHAGLVEYIASGDYLQVRQHTAGRSADCSLDDITYLPVIPRPEKIVCAVRNYMDHHQEVLAAGMHRELSSNHPSSCACGAPKWPMVSPSFAPRYLNHWIGRANWR